MSIKDKILQQASNVKTFPLEVADWDCTIYMRRLSVKETFELEGKSDVLDNSLVAVKVFQCCCDENGVPLFDASEVDQMKEKTCFDTFKKLLDHFNEINGFSIDAAKKN